MIAPWKSLDQLEAWATRNCLRCRRTGPWINENPHHRCPLSTELIAGYLRHSAIPEDVYRWLIDLKPPAQINRDLPPSEYCAAYISRRGNTRTRPMFMPLESTIHDYQPIPTPPNDESGFTEAKACLTH